MRQNAVDQPARDACPARLLPYIHAPQRPAMPPLLAVVKLAAGDTDKLIVLFRTDHVVGLQPVGEERERPRALLLEGRAEGGRVSLEALQADRAECLCIGAGQAADRKRG